MPCIKFFVVNSNAAVFSFTDPLIDLDKTGMMFKYQRGMWKDLDDRVLKGSEYSATSIIV